MTEPCFDYLRTQAQLGYATQMLILWTTEHLFDRAFGCVLVVVGTIFDYSFYVELFRSCSVDKNNFLGSNLYGFA